MADSSIVDAIALGVVEGLTEFIPVSSTGHLILFGEWLGFKGASATTFEVFIQLGAILAILFLYWPRFLGLLNIKSANGFSGVSGITKIGVACLPAFVIGFLTHGFIKQQLFGIRPVAFALICWGLVMLVAERSKTEPSTLNLEQISVAQAFWIGCFQVLALWPGVSRSGSTIVGGMFLGLRRDVAAEFSFIVAVPVMFAAVLYDLLKSWSSLGLSDVPLFGVGFVVSFVTAIVAVKFFIRVLNAWTLVPFGYYRIGLGVLVICLGSL